MEHSNSPSLDEGRGYLIVRTTTARGAIPISDARVDIRNQLPEDNEAAGDVILSLLTDRDGSTGPIPLPAPPKAYSQRPDSERPPYATYHIEVRKNGYGDETFIGVPIFDGITAIQTVDLIPLPENGKENGFAPYNSSFTETEAPNL